MTVTYTDDTMRTTSVDADVFVPRYAQAKRSKKGPKTWMILAPIGALALIGGGAAMIMGGGAETQPLVEPEPVAVLVQPIETAPAPLESSVAPVVMTPAAAAPVVRNISPAPAERRAIPVERRAESAPAATPRVEVVPEPIGPRPYSAAPSTAATMTMPPAPAIRTAPLN